MSSIIFVVIVGMWAVVLIPMWLRSHDAAAESKSVDRFSTAMRTLSRRSAPGSRDVLMPARGTRAEVSGGRAPAAADRRARAAARQQLRRRRSIVLGLAGFLAVVLLAELAGAAPLWLLGAAILGTAGYGGYLRVQAVNAADAARRERRARTRTAAPARRVPAPARAREVAPTWPVTASPSVPAPVEVATSGVYVDAAADGAWTAIPVILPTYVTAPPATSVPRVIDLTHPGSWSAAQMLEHAAAAGEPDPDEIFDRLADDEPAPYDHASAHEAVAATVAGSTAHPYLDEELLDDAVFDQEDDALNALLDRRAVND